MPILARMLPAPLSMEVRRGAVAQLGSLLADSRVATSGRVAVAVGAGQGDRIASVITPSLGEAQVFRVPDGSVDAAISLGADLRKGRTRRSWASAAARPST